MRDKNLTCYGCCHSAGMEPFPSSPSGERPCCFCIRNPKLPKKTKHYTVKVWYDGSEPIKVPMDCYYSLDMFRQVNKWTDEKKEGKL